MQLYWRLSHRPKGKGCWEKGGQRLFFQIAQRWRNGTTAPSKRSTKAESISGQFFFPQNIWHFRTRGSTMRFGMKLLLSSLPGKGCWVSKWIVRAISLRSSTVPVRTTTAGRSHTGFRCRGKTVRKGSLPDGTSMTTRVIGRLFTSRQESGSLNVFRRKPPKRGRSKDWKAKASTKKKMHGSLLRPAGFRP